MKYSAQQYAQALYESLVETKPDHHEIVMDNFVAVLKEQGDFGLFSEIAEAYTHYEKSARGIKTAEVTSARQLTESVQQKIIHELNELLGAQIELKQKIDEGLLGGVVVRMEDKLIDGSVKKQLSDLKSNLSK